MTYDGTLTDCGLMRLRAGRAKFVDGQVATRGFEGRELGVREGEEERRIVT